MSKYNYVKRCLGRLLVKGSCDCPNCGSRRSHVVETKHLITQLRRCAECMLQFRTPTDDPRRNQDFYENEYSQGFTTELPENEELARLVSANFAGSQKDYSSYISVLGQIGLNRGARLFDYGCSWGYGSYQLGKHGFKVCAYEVAPSRRAYAIEKLGVAVAADMEEIIDNEREAFDCFFSAHVLEHVPRPAEAFEYALRLLKPHGLFVAFMPNGSASHRLVDRNWSRLWGDVHPNFIDEVFLDKSFEAVPRAIGSSPITNAKLPADPVSVRLNALDGSELFFVARKAGDTWSRHEKRADR